MNNALPGSEHSASAVRLGLDSVNRRSVYARRSIIRVQPRRTSANAGHAEVETLREQAAFDLLAPENIHVQQVVRASDDRGRAGIGVLEQIAIGPYAPAGFTDFFDGA